MTTVPDRDAAVRALFERAEHKWSFGDRICFQATLHRYEWSAFESRWHIANRHRGRDALYAQPSWNPSHYAYGEYEGRFPPANGLIVWRNEPRIVGVGVVVAPSARVAYGDYHLGAWEMPNYLATRGYLRVIVAAVESRTSRPLLVRLDPTQVWPDVRVPVEPQGAQHG